jgi:hypothetical protein
MSLRRTGYSRPQSKHIYDVVETQLFISGKSAKRPSSQAPNDEVKFSIGRKNRFMGTWAPLQHPTKQFGL